MTSRGGRRFGPPSAVAGAGGGRGPIEPGNGLEAADCASNEVVDLLDHVAFRRGLGPGVELCGAATRTGPLNGAYQRRRDPQRLLVTAIASQENIEIVAALSHVVRTLLGELCPSPRRGHGKGGLPWGSRGSLGPICDNSKLFVAGRSVPAVAREVGAMSPKSHRVIPLLAATDCFARGIGARHRRIRSIPAHDRWSFPSRADAYRPPPRQAGPWRRD